MASKKPNENQSQPAGSDLSYLDQHPRPSRAPEAAPFVAVEAEAKAAAVDPHKCTPTKIKKTGSNGDEEELEGPDGKPNYIGNFHKGLPHDGFGEVDRKAYQSLLHALSKKKDFDKIILGLGRKLTNPQSGLATDVEGPDPKKLHILAAPKLASVEEAAEGVELYWMALLRDVPFTKYDTNQTVCVAAEELSDLKEFTGPKIGGKVTRQTIFRGCSAGDNVGPYLSQFLLHDIGYGSLTVLQKQKTVKAEKKLPDEV